MSRGCLNVANARGNTGLAVALLLGFGLLIGASVATTVNLNRHLANFKLDARSRPRAHGVSGERSEDGLSP